MRWLVLIALLIASNATTFYVTKKNLRPKPWDRDPASLLARVAQSKGSIVVMGDSLTAGATLPEEVCGHQVINAGVGGARVATFVSFAEDIRKLNLEPSLVVIALGVNDAMNHQTDFRSAYALLVSSLPETRLAIATIAPVETKEIDPHRIATMDDVIREIAASRKATLIELSAIEGFETVDGIHPTNESRALWVRAMTNGIKQAMCP